MWIDEKNIGKMAAAIASHLRQHLAPGDGANGNGGGAVKASAVFQSQRCLTAEEAARYLGITKQALWHLRARGAFREHGVVIQRGRSVRFDRMALDKWIEAHRL
jgi:excisionase family DNA binding protein